LLIWLLCSASAFAQSQDKEEKELAVVELGGSAERSLSLGVYEFHEISTGNRNLVRYQGLGSSITNLRNIVGIVMKEFAHCRQPNDLYYILA